MCGLTALSRATSTSIPNARRFMCAATVAIESRGRDATGFGWADATGHPWYSKLPGPATSVAHRLDLPRRGLRTVIGHTRHFTTGDPSVNANNHPVTAPGMVLAHNGRVDNTAELYRMTGATPVAEVDSESLVWLLHEAAIDGLHPSDVLGLVEGVASIAWLDSDDPHGLHLARLSTRPMTLGWTRRGDFVMSSTPLTMSRTARLTGVSIGNVIEVEEGTYMRVEQGAITEVATFDVRHPVELPPDDRPGAVASTSPVDADGIDWDALVPRRGWA